MESNPFTDLVGLEDAALYSCLSKRHLRLLLKQGKIMGKKIGRDWITTKDEIDKYISTKPKSGPKPKKG